MKVTQIIAGIVAGIAGAAAWAAIAFFAGVNSGIVAWGIGALVGFAIAATGRSGKLPGVAAVVITIVAILAGKYGSSELAMLRVHRINQEAMTDLDEDIDKAVITARAHRLAEQRMKEGEELIWPEGMALEDAEEPEDFPHELWSEVRQEWEAKSETERDALRKEHIENVKEAFAMLHGVFKGMNNAFFWASFGWRDMLYFGVAIFTVWWIAGRSDDEAGDE